MVRGNEQDQLDEAINAALLAAGHDLSLDVCARCWEAAQALATRDPSRSAEEYYSNLTIEAEEAARAAVAQAASA